MTIELDKSAAHLPLYQQIAHAVSRAILTRKIIPGSKLPAHLELARSLGVSSVTVCQGYKLLASRRIIRQTRGSGAFVEADALQRLRSSLGRTFGRLWIVLGETELAKCKRETLFIFANFLDGVRQALEGQQTTFQYTQNLTRDELRDVHDDDAVLLVSPVKIDLSFMDELLRRGIPVAAATSRPRLLRIPRIDTDRHEATALALEHLFACGYKRIGFIGSKVLPWEPICEKFAAFSSLMHQAGLDVLAKDVREVHADFGKAFIAAQNLVRQGDLPEAFFVDTDYKAMEVISVLQMAGLRVPKDVAIVSYDDVADGETFDPPLTTVHIPRIEQGFRAAQLLLNWPRDGSMPDDITLTPHLVVRRSCGAASPVAGVPTNTDSSTFTATI